MTGITAASLADLPGLRHAFLTRQGGVSAGPFASLNLGQRSGDDPANIATNRQRAAALLGGTADRLVTARQVHSATCLAVTEPWAPDAPPEADALATDRPGLLLGVLTADCAPVLLADPEARVVGAAHAGWRGALSGIVEATVATMRRLGADPQRIRAAVGPCIARESYEVGPEFEQRFLAEDPDSARHFTPAEAPTAASSTSRPTSPTASAALASPSQRCCRMTPARTRPASSASGGRRSGASSGSGYRCRWSAC